ncbi:hypothetical protein ACT3RR_22410 [Ewingella sp. AOP8-B2-18]
MDQQMPKWLNEARKMITRCDSRSKHFWNNLEGSDRRCLCFISKVEGKWAEASWEELREADRVSLWQGILRIRRLQGETALLTPEDFKGAGACRVAPREVEQDVNNSMH